MRAVFAVAPLMALAAVAALPDVAAACSCVKRTPAELLAGADQAFVGRASAPTAAGAKTRQVFHVLASLKGSVPSNFVLERSADEVSTCDAQFKDGQTSVVFVKAGRASVCAGNYDLSVQLPDLPALLRHGASAPARPDGAAFAKVFEATLAGYLHGRKEVTVVWADLPAGAPLTVKVLGTTYTFGAASKDRAAVRITDSAARGYLAAVSLTYPIEGVVAHALVAEAKSGWEVLGTSVVEQSGKGK